jgi:hypothetical protein
VQARVASVAARGADGVMADMAEAYCPRSEGLARREAGCATCLDTNEMLNNSSQRKDLGNEAERLYSGDYWVKHCEIRSLTI